MASKAKINKWWETLFIIFCFAVPMAISMRFLWPGFNHNTTFGQYYAVSYLMHHGDYNQIYRNSFFIPPVLAWLFSPLSLAKFQTALYLWIGICAALMLYGSTMLCQSLGIKGKKRIWTTLFLGSFGPAALSIWHAEITPLLFFAASGLFIMLKKRRFMDASIYQFIFWLKPYLIIPLLVYEIGAGQSILVIISILLAIIGLLICCLLVGIGVLNDYWQLCNSAGLNTSLITTLQAFAVPNKVLQIGLPIDSYKLVLVIVYLLFLGLAYWLGQQVRSKKLQGVILFSVLIPLTISLFSSHMACDLLLIAPGILLFEITEIDGWRKYLKVIMTLLLLVVFFLPDFLVINSLSISRNGVFSPFFWTTFIFAIVAFIVDKYHRQISGVAVPE